MISFWKLRDKKNVAQMHFVKITPDLDAAAAFVLNANAIIFIDW